MTGEQREILSSAVQRLDEARRLHSKGLHGLTASSAYYAMVYAAQALLQGEGVSFSTDAAVIGSFTEHFIRSRRVPVELHRLLLDAKMLRDLGLYAHAESVSSDQAEEQITRAEEFLRAVQHFLEPPAEEPR